MRRMLISFFQQRIFEKLEMAAAHADVSPPPLPVDEDDDSKQLEVLLVRATAAVVNQMTPEASFSLARRLAWLAGASFTLPCLVRIT